jgi:hypothetical protein
MTDETPVRRTWRDTAVVRVLGSVLAWFSTAAALTLLYRSADALAALGGYCARGGPYVIAVECTDAIAIFMPLSIVGGLAALAIGTGLAGGFGTPTWLYAWPGLFVSLSVVFFRTFLLGGDGVGLFLGLLFLVMGLAPLALILPAAPQRMLIGRVDAQGRAFWEAHPARAHLLSLRTPAAPGENRATAADWALSLGIAIVAATLGVAVGGAWFSSVA